MFDKAVYRIKIYTKIESFGFEKHTTDESQTSDETGLV